MVLLSLLLQTTIRVDEPIYLPPIPPSKPWTPFDYLELILGLFLFVVILSMIVRPRVALKNWHHHFEELQLSSRTVYQEIINQILERQMPGVTFSYAKYFEAGIFSARREYLCIEYKKFSLDVCCIAFGTGYYMSWWLGQADPGFFSRVPILNNLLGLNPQFESYYQKDTATLFQSGVHDAILSVIDEISKEKGIRTLTEMERQPRIGRL